MAPFWDHGRSLSRKGKEVFKALGVEEHERCMGVTWSSPVLWRLYARGKADDRYVPDPLWTTNDLTETTRALGMFKHEVYKFALNHVDYHEFKCIYLYCGAWRIGKVERLVENAQTKCPTSIRVTFSDAEHAGEWGRCLESLGPSRWGLRSQAFHARFILSDSKLLERTYVNPDCLEPSS